MPKDFPEQRDPSTAGSHGYAAESEVIPADRALLDSATGEDRRDPADRESGDLLADDDAVYMDIGTQPMSDITAIQETSGYEETADGLDDTEETVRQQAEDRVEGDDEDYRT